MMHKDDWMKEGIFAIYKEEGITSHDAIDMVRRCTGQRRVGHAGTLDLCARGVLVVGVGRAATRQLSAAAGKEKEYVVRIRLGRRSTTDDREGCKQDVSVADIPSEDRIRQVLKSFEGMISQRPPAFSAIKLAGRAAYRLARASKPVDLPARQVEAREIELVGYVWPLVDLRLVTGPGVYVRSLARDLGEALGTGGYVEQLERTRVGEYTKEQAVRLADLKDASRAGFNAGKTPDDH
jgi:tRNA pseudouridine55 synthase